MKLFRLIIFITLFFLLKIFSGCTTPIDISKENASEKHTLFLIQNRTFEPINLVDIFFEEISIRGYEMKDVSSVPAEPGTEEKDQGFYGSGFFISEEGLFLTAYHVIEKAENIVLRKINGDLFKAEVFIEDPESDIAILSVIGGQKENYWLSLENFHAANTGDEVRVLGYPVPNLVGTKPKFAVGYISSIAGIGGDTTRFEISAPLEPGCSGAAIINRHNEVIGIASEQTNDEWFLVTRTGPLPPDINFGVKIENARMLLEECLEDIPRKGSKSTSLEDVVNSTALVLINTQNVPAGFQSESWDRIILVEFSRLYLCHILHYTVFDFNRGSDQVMGEVLASGYIGGVPISNPNEVVEAFIREMRIKAIL